MLAILPLSILPGALARAETLSSPDDAALRGLPAGLSGAFPAFVLSTLLLLSSAPYLKVEIREPTAEQGPVSMAALMRFQRTSDEMTGVTAWVDPTRRPIWSDMAETWVQGKPVGTRVDYGQVPQTEELADELGRRGHGARADLLLHDAEPGKTITFNRFWYPGWTAWLLDGKNGRPVETAGRAARRRAARAGGGTDPAGTGLHPAPIRGHARCGWSRNGSRAR